MKRFFRTVTSLVSVSTQFHGKFFWNFFQHVEIFFGLIYGHHDNSSQARRNVLFDQTVLHNYLSSQFLYSWKFWKNKKVEFSIPVLHFRYASAVKKVKKCVILDQEFRAVISGTWFPNELITCMDVSCVCAFSKTTRSHKIHKIFHLQ